MHCFKAGAGDALANQGRDGLAVFPPPETNTKAMRVAKSTIKSLCSKINIGRRVFGGVSCRTIKEL